MTDVILHSSKSCFDINKKQSTLQKLWTIQERIAYIRDRMDHYYKQVPENDIMDALNESEPLDDNSHFSTYIVIKFHPKIDPKTVFWIVNKIKEKRHYGGAELIVRKQPFDPDEGLVLHVSATKFKLLELAEEMEIVKRDRFGTMREFIVNQLDDFMDTGMTVDDFLTTAEKQTIVKHELDNIRALSEDTHVPGYANISLYQGQSIIELCLQKGIIEKIYPLHDPEYLKKLARTWYKPVLLRQQPIEDIRTYFGEAIALYFVFLGFYTTALLIPMILGILQTFLSSETLPFFCVFNVIWVTVFLELWKRKCSELAYTWGTIGMTSLDEPRANYYGQMGIDPVSRRIQPQYPRWKTYAKMYCVSFPFVFFCMAVSFIVMLTSFWLEDFAKMNIPPTNEYRSYLISLPSVVYAGLVYIMNAYYRIFATKLTEWENHRTQSQFDRHRATKLVLFEFVNNFMSLFYIAFVIKDLEMLKNQLMVMLIILQIINNFQEAILPLLIQIYVEKIKKIRKYVIHQVESMGSLKKRGSNAPSSVNDNFYTEYDRIATLDKNDYQIKAAQSEGKMDSYEGTYDDYLEMFIQFGYVMLFSPVYPLAAFWAVLNNIFEIRSDAFKLCMAYQRPPSRRAKDIGAWQKAFEILGALSILTNCGLLALSMHTRAENKVEFVLLFVFIEHILLLIRYIIHLAIPDKPEWVRVALARRNYESKQALKNEKATKNRRLFIRRFTSTPGDYEHNI